MQMKPLLKPLNEDEAASLEWLTQTAHERHVLEGRQAERTTISDLIGFDEENS